MADVVFVLILLAFFGLAALFARACDRIIGPDEAAPQAAQTSDEGDKVAA